MKKKILFLTGTRADYGKLKSLMKEVQNNSNFELGVFITGMHMLSKYGSTWTEITKDGFTNIYQYINQQDGTPMDLVLSNTIIGLSNYVKENNPDIIVVHGDRLEALAGAIVGAFNNIKVAHIEGGEVSGTIDESIRHSITKLSHIHLVSNESAKRRVIQLGESEDSIFVIGSPDIDIMMSPNLPTLMQVRRRYNINFENYSILMYHPVTTELNKLEEQVFELVESLIESDRKYVVIYPNNDKGSSIILDEYKKINGHPNFKVFPSIRFEYFLTLLNNADFIIGNSSVGIREAEIYGVPAIDIGNRQKNRYKPSQKNIIHITEKRREILEAINITSDLHLPSLCTFGNGDSHKKFMEILLSGFFWESNIQKYFVDIE